MSAQNIQSSNNFEENKQNFVMRISKYLTKKKEIS